MRTSPILLAAVVAASLTGSGATARALTATTTATKTSYLKPVVPFIEDDYARAIAEARARKVPLFVEAWAPW